MTTHYDTLNDINVDDNFYHNKEMKLIPALILLLLNGQLHCATSRFFPGTRAGEISLFFINDITRIIKDYDRNSCTETRSKNYYAYVQNAHRWNSKIVLYNSSGIELQTFYASYIRAIALSPCEDIIMVMHEKSKGRWYGIPYRYITANLFWRSLALTGISIPDGTSRTVWPSWAVQKRIEQVAFIQRLRSLYPECKRPSDPFLSPISGPLTHQKEHVASTSEWPDISQARIKRMRIAQDETLSVTLYDPAPLINRYEKNITPTSYTHKLSIEGQYCLEKMRSR
jgi:hypothetical protein